MSRSRVVVPVVVRLPLSDGDFLDVKQDLNAGEYFDLLVAFGERQAFAKVLAYVLGWSLVGVDNTPLPWDLDGPEATRRDTLRSLDKDTIRELVAAVDRHEAAQDAAREKKRQTPSTAPTSSAPSTSPDAAAGATSGSTHSTATSTT